MKPVAPEQFRWWKAAAERVAAREMPPEDSDQPTAAEREAFARWYRGRFTPKDGKPAPFRVRRLSTHEYRRTMESLFGFPLTVATTKSEQTKSESSLILKLMPPDPRGPSGYTNDTSGNPITANVWEKYSYVADAAPRPAVQRGRAGGASGAGRPARGRRPQPRAGGQGARHVSRPGLAAADRRRGGGPPRRTHPRPRRRQADRRPQGRDETHPHVPGVPLPRAAHYPLPGGVRPARRLRVGGAAELLPLGGHAGRRVWSPPRPPGS